MEEERGFTAEEIATLLKQQGLAVDPPHAANADQPHQAPAIPRPRRKPDSTAVAPTPPKPAQSSPPADAPAAISQHPAPQNPKPEEPPVSHPPAAPVEAASVVAAPEQAATSSHNDSSQLEAAKTLPTPPSDSKTTPVEEPCRLISDEDFDADLVVQQKKLEETVRKRTQLVAATVAERAAKAAQEMRVLQMVQGELAKLDRLLQPDVDRLRNLICDAAWSLENAERRLKRAEKEFIAAKMEQHMRQEEKQSLTDRLYALIQENEVRKAQKLDELMAKLRLCDLDMEDQAAPAGAEGWT
eukprot:NODE_645_length_1274_cov_365.031837_g510_i0.p1 GENE.NODE_645_length_1274_cov_365.031837_g510_i0~~NODE_645_length_1274_cov_365.031837_g510_i0.p1  ORF type:complete len:299 (+),score=16.98 NODE_645_length_1274_cov_365.031837_g510_i0:70-966(+)